MTRDGLRIGLGIGAHLLITYIAAGLRRLADRLEGT
jgi:hypothetical protein